MKTSFKKTQKQINKIVRDYNRALEEDEAFRGRIYIRQYSCGFHEFSDGSGVVWYGVLRVYDKVTNTYKSILCDNYNIQHKLVTEVNNFIMLDLQYDLHKAITLGIDYRSVKHNPAKAKPFYDYYDANYSYKTYG